MNAQPQSHPSPGQTASDAADASEVVTAKAITLNVNGKKLDVMVEPRTTLLDALRERLHLTGTKKGCDHGQCGCCTVHVNGERIMSCLTLAVMHATENEEGDQITTIEGLAKEDELHPMQAAFVKHDGFQCGYCTSGQIMSAVALVGEGMADNLDNIRMGMTGNLCRCSAYPNITSAILEGAGNMQEDN